MTRLLLSLLACFGIVYGAVIGVTATGLTSFLGFVLLLVGGVINDTICYNRGYEQATADVAKIVAATTGETQAQKDVSNL